MTPEEQQELLEETEPNIRFASTQVSRRFRGFVTYADLYQEGIEWVLRHPGTCRSKLSDGRRGSFRLTAMVAKHMEKLARREKAAQSRYSVEDEAFYNRTLIETCLPAVWDDNYLYGPPQDEEAPEVRKRKDPAETSSWLVSVLDVRRAWAEAVMDDNWRLALSYRFGEGLRIWQVAQLLEVADSTAQSYIDKGIRAMVTALGGSAPHGCQSGCECGYVGSRRVMSNAEARARTGQDYDD